ncbi:uncharacterized protein LOC126898471 [Daktulosphaira vitifoliae]|uniref:uncharacterized protein LOC126898471 n=1 Tax=Daktulosphaira vitifoliae TaxID=58002 RepID=UPI0021A9C659|nr:uncharacterized protein LOC126898471 [Daktulosphaira vitifoliae]
MRFNRKSFVDHSKQISKKNEQKNYLEKIELSQPNMLDSSFKTADSEAFANLVSQPALRMQSSHILATNSYSNNAINHAITVNNAAEGTTTDWSIDIFTRKKDPETEMKYNLMFDKTGMVHRYDKDEEKNKKDMEINMAQ